MTPPPRTPSEVLRAARELITRPGGWTQHVSARDAQGRPVASWSDEACSFCLAGAVSRVLGATPHKDPLVSGVYRALKSAGAPKPITYNDAAGRTQAEVVALAGRAAELAETAA